MQLGFLFLRSSSTLVGKFTTPSNCCPLGTNNINSCKKVLSAVWQYLYSVLQTIILLCFIVLFTRQIVIDIIIILHKDSHLGLFALQEFIFQPYVAIVHGTLLANLSIEFRIKLLQKGFENLYWKIPPKGHTQIPVQIFTIAHRVSRRAKILILLLRRYSLFLNISPELYSFCKLFNASLAFSSPCSAAKRHHFTASSIFCSTLFIHSVL